MSKAPKKIKPEQETEIVNVVSTEKKQENKMNLILTYAKVFKCGVTWVESLIDTIINMTKNGQL